MKILEFVPVEKTPEKKQPGVVYLPNVQGCTTLADKIARMKGYDFDYAVFRHADTTIETPEALEVNCNRMRMDNVGVAGVIGTLFMSESCAWWLHKRGVVTAGAIMQGDGKGGAYPMIDGAGYRVDAVGVDGCFMVFSREFIARYEAHPYHWRFGYDLDACFQALSMGMKVGILDIRVRHDSQGSFDSKEFDEYRQKFLARWKPHVDFPVIAQSTFS